MKYCPEIIIEICDYLKKNYGRVGSAEKAGITFETFNTWMKKPEFSDAVKKAEKEANTKGKEIAIQTIFRAMADKQWTAAAWWLERKFRKEYGKDIEPQEKREPVVFRFKK